MGAAPGSYTKVRESFNKSYEAFPRSSAGAILLGMHVLDLISKGLMTLDAFACWHGLGVVRTKRGNEKRHLELATNAATTAVIAAGLRVPLNQIAAELPGIWDAMRLRAVVIMIGIATNTRFDTLTDLEVSSPAFIKTQYQTVSDRRRLLAFHSEASDAVFGRLGTPLRFAYRMALRGEPSHIFPEPGDHTELQAPLLSNIGTIVRTALGSRFVATPLDTAIHNLTLPDPD